MNRSGTSRRALCVATFAIASLSTSPLNAQTQRDTTRADSSQVFELRGLSVRVPRPATTTGGASAVSIRLDSISVQPAPTLEQVLREMPLVVIRANSRGEAQPALRGGEDRQIAVLVDGIPITLGWDHRTDLSVVPLTAAREITLIRGLSSMLHGPNVLGGVVEIDVARGAERQRAPEPVSFALSVDHVGATQIGATAGAARDRAGRQWVVRGGLGYRDAPGYPVPDEIEEANRCGPADVLCLSRAGLLRDGDDLRLNSDVNQLDGFATARYLTEGGRWLSFSGSGYSATRGVPPEIHESEPRLWRYPDQWRVLGALNGGTGQHDTPWGAGDLEFSLGLDRGRTEIDEYATPGYDRVVGGEDADDRTLTARLHADHSLGERSELRAALTYADVSHDETLSPGGSAEYRQRLWSLGTEAEWQLGGVGTTGTTRLTIGAAVDGADTPESGDKPALERLWDWGARVGATSSVGASGAFLLHGGVSRRTRFPALRELYSGALGRFEPNPSLRPEALIVAEGGFTVRHRFGELQAVGFHQRLEDAIVRVGVETAEGRKFQRVNRDEIRSTGLELLTIVEAGRLVATADLTLQTVDLIDPSAGTTLEAEYEPTMAGKITTQTALPGALTALGDLRYRGEQLCALPGGGQGEIAADAVVDFGVRRVFQWAARALGRMDLLLMVDNVTDSGSYDQCGLPQPGRTARVQIHLR